MQVAQSVPEPVIKYWALCQQHLHPITEALEPLVSGALQDCKDAINTHLANDSPWQIVILTVIATLGLVFVVNFGGTLLARARSLCSPPALFQAIRSIPPVRAYLEKVKAKLRSDMIEKRPQLRAPLTTLPVNGTPIEELRQKLMENAKHDVNLDADTQSKLSGSVYFSSNAHKALLDAVYAAHSFSNPLHPDAWPSVRQMEAEVIAMTAGLLGGGPGTQVCGAMTSGGTESILSAIKASRDYMCSRRGIRAPEMIVAQSAHAAYWKCAEYFGIKLHVVPVGRDYRLSARAVARRMNANTVVVVASAPGYPHGVVDHVADIARVARRRGVCVHVDACLGGFYLPFARMEGANIPPWDFSVPGVTSISVDTHKYGMAHKGTSVVLYVSPSLRCCQYTRVTDWTGGLYISPGIAGSRPGALIATAWASLVLLGEEGFRAVTRRLMAATQALVEGLRDIPDLEVVGSPEMCLVAFRSTHRDVNIYSLNDLLTARGWQLNALQMPAALHFCITAMNAGSVPALLDDLRAVAAQLRADPRAVRGGSAPVYGMCNASPDRGLLAEFLVAFQDTQLTP